MMTSMYKKTVDKKLELLVAKIENIELAADGERDEKIRDLETKVDDLQQKDRERNILRT